MKKNLLFRLCLMMSVILSLSSCIHDEVYSSSDSSAGYTNKTLWKQDEKYIKNVMDVYSENENDIRTSSGVPYWDYATTVESFDESFLMVPVVSDNKVVSVLQVPRKGDKVHFYYTNYTAQLSFFQGLVFAKYKKAVLSENTYSAKSVICTTQVIAVWYPADESDPDPESGNGSWGTRLVTVCKEEKELCAGIVDEFGQCEGSGAEDDGGDDPGYEYPGDEEEPIQLPTPKDPCKKTKSIYNSTAVKSRYEILKGKTSEPNESGYGFKTVSDGNGGTTTQTNSLNPDVNPDKMKVGIYTTSFGYIHTHLDKTGDKMAIKIFSPADINAFLSFLHNAKANGTSLSDIFGGMIASDPDTGYNIYQMTYTGTGTDLPAEFTKQQLDALKSWYIGEAQQMLNSNEGSLPHSDMQKIFYTMLKKMNLKDVVLSKIEYSTNKINTVKFDNTGSPSEQGCPQ